VTDESSESRLYQNDLHEAACRYFEASNGTSLVLSTGTVECRAPDLALLLAYDLVPNLLTAIALDAYPIESSLPSPPVEDQKKDYQERVLGIVKHIVPDVEYLALDHADRIMIEYLANGLLETPNVFWFRNYVKDALEAEVKWYQSPPSTWGTFAKYRDKIFLYDLDRAAMIYLRHHVEKEKELWVELVTAGFAIGTTRKAIG
jgi:hypothetical protein